MWRLLLSGLLCLPAVAFVFVGWNDNFAQKSQETTSPATVIPSSNAEAPALQLSLPSVEFSAEPALPDPDAWELDASTDPIAPHKYVAMRRRVRRNPNARLAALNNTPQPDPPNLDGGIGLFISRHLTRYSFAPPNQNGGG